MLMVNVDGRWTMLMVNVNGQCIGSWWSMMIVDGPPNDSEYNEDVIVNRSVMKMIEMTNNENMWDMFYSLESYKPFEATP